MRVIEQERGEMTFRPPSGEVTIRRPEDLVGADIHVHPDYIKRVWPGTSSIKPAAKEIPGTEWVRNGDGKMIRIPVIKPKK